MKSKTVTFAVVLLVALVFRLWISDKGWHVDLWSNAAWGEWVLEHGPARFYDNNIWAYAWPTQLPLVNSVYAFNKRLFIEMLGRMAWVDYQVSKVYKVESLSRLVWWWGYGRVNLEIPFQIGYLVTMKLFPILADLVIAGVIFVVGQRKLKWPIIYLASPFSWYLSAGWGQYDGVSFGLALLGFLSIFGNLSFLGPALIVLAVLIKPTALIIVPFFGYLYFRKMNKMLGIKILGLILPLLIFWITTQPYTHKNPFEFARYDLSRIVFEKSEPRISVNSFNFWRMIIGDAGYTHERKFWFVPAQIWGLVAFGVLNALGIWWWEKNYRSQKDMWTSLFIIAMGSWMFMTQMLERYAFAGVVFGLMAVIANPRYLKYWLGIAFLFWLNLYYRWWWPAELGFVQSILSWQKELPTQFLSAIQVWLFGLMTVNLIELPKLHFGSFRKLRYLPALKPKRPA